jgi:hypothetical protein
MSVDGRIIECQGRGGELDFWIDVPLAAAP